MSNEPTKLRQDVILEMYESGKPTKIIGRELGLSPNTIMQQIVMARRRRLITQLEARAEAAEAKVAKLVEALQAICATAHADDYVGWHTALEEATAALVEIDGEK